MKTSVTIPIGVGCRALIDGPRYFDPVGVTFFAGHACIWSYPDDPQRDQRGFQREMHELVRRDDWEFGCQI